MLMPQSIFAFFRRGWPVACWVPLALSVVACGSATVSVQGSSGTSQPNQAQTFTDSATLNWTPVTQDSNGAVLMDLAGYEIFYGSSASAMDTRVELPDPTQTTYLVTNLARGTWYFAVAAYTSDGTQGVLSNVASKTID